MFSLGVVAAVPEEGEAGRGGAATDARFRETEMNHSPAFSIANADSPVSSRRFPGLAPFILSSMMLLLAVLFAPPQAHSVTHSVVFVKNNSQANNLFTPFNKDIAQGFRTGTHTAGYTLKSTHLYLSIDTGSANVPVFTVGIWSESGGDPNQFVGSLTPPGNIVAGGMSFTTTGIDLAANTVYFIIVDVSTDGERYQWIATNSDAEDSSRIQPGWTINNISRQRNSNGSTIWTSTLSAAQEIRIDGYLKTATSTFGIADASAAEGDAATFTVTLDAAASEEVTVDWATSVATSNTAAQSDFSEGNGTLTFAAGDIMKTFTVATVEDSVDEDDETFTVTLSNVNPASAASLPADATAIGTITDDDQAALGIADAGADEGDDITFTVTLNPTSSREVKVDWATSVETGDTAVQADFTADSGTLNFGVGDTSKTITVATVEDTAIEPDETFTVTLSDASEATLPADPTATGTIGDDDTAPMLSISVNNASIAEDGGTSTVTISTGSGPTFATDQTITLTLAGTAGESRDYVISSESLTLAAGATTVTATVTAVDDNYDDDAETIIVTASNGGDDIGSQTITITDDDDPPAFSLILSDSAPSEAGAETSMLTVSLGSGSVFEFSESVSFELSGTAGEKDDYDVDMQEVTIEGGENMVSTTLTVVDDNYDDDAETVVIDVVYDDTTVATGTITITDDDDAPVLSVAVNNASVAEAAGASMLTVSTGSGATFEDDQTITLTLGGTATIGVDYTIGSISLTLPYGEDHDASEVTTTITAVQDRIDEPDETILIDADRVTGSSTSVDVGTRQTVTITDDDQAPLSIADASADEGDSATFTVTLNPAAADEVTVDYATSVAASDTAAQSDFTAKNGTLTFAAGDTTETFTVATLEDSVDEVDETFTVTLSNASGSTLPADATATGTIIDDDQAALAIAAAAADEGDDITFTVTLDPVSSREVTVDWATSVETGDTAVQADFTADSGTLTFAAGDSSKTFTVATTEETAIELDETFTVTLSDASGATLPAVPTATGTIGDDDTPRVSIASGGNVAQEGTAATFTLTMSPAAPAGGLTVNVTVAEVEQRTLETGELAYDFVAAASEGMTTVDFAAGDTSATLTVPTVDDDLYEAEFGDDNLLRATLAAGTGYAVATGSGTAELTLRDGAARPVLSWKTAKVTVTEGVDANAALVLTLTHALVGEVAFALTATQISASLGSDFTSGVEDAVFAPGTTEVTTLVPIVDSPQHLEATEAFDVTFAHAVASQPVAVPPTATERSIQVEILDPDTMQLDPTAVSARVVEGDAIEITIDTLPSGICPHFGVFFVTVTPSGDTATLAAADAVERRFAPCESTQTVSFATREDTAVTANRALSFTLATKAGTDSRITVVTDNVVEVAVIDDDRHATGAPAIAGTAEVGRKLTASPGTIADGDGLTGASYSYTWIRVDGATETAITGTTGNGYTPVAADQGKTLKVRASFTDDEGFDEHRESAETATVAAAPTMPTFGITDASAAEGDAVTFTVTLNPAAGAAATVGWATSVETGDTAVQADFTAGSGTLSFGAGDTSKTFTVATVEDTGVEPGETFTVTLSSASSGTALPTDATATGTIANDDGIGAFSIADASAAEGDAVTFTVTHAPAATQQVTVDWATSVASGNSAAQTDFTAGSGTVTFAVGDSSKTFTVATVEDTGVESNETFTVTLSNVGPAGAATLADATATGTITDDDTLPTLSISVSSSTVAEAGGTSTVTISTGSGPTFSSAQTITLALTGTAAESDDYTIASKSLTLAAGATSVTTTVTAVQDSIDDDAETVIVTASNGGDTIGSQTVTITDDDAAPVLSISVSSDTVAEAAGTSTVTVGTGAGSTFTTDQTITLALDGTAAESDDYTIASKSLTLAAGATSVTTTVTAVQDVIDDDAETVIVTASNGGDTIGSQTVTITDDDAPPTLSISVSSGTVAEEAGTSTVTVGTGAGSTFTTDQTITLALDGTAAESDDYTIASKSLTLAAGATSVTTTVTAVQDSIDDDAETVIVTASNGGDTIGSQTITITDDDDAPTLSISVNNASIAEAAGTSTVTVGTGAGSTFATAQTITLTLEDGTASKNDDYTISSESLTLAAGAATVTATVTAVDDNYDDDDETVIVTAGNGGDSIGSQTITIADDDAAPTFTFTVSDSSPSEAGEGTSMLTVSLGGTSVFEDNQNLHFELSGTAGEKADYDIPDLALLLGSNLTTVSATLTVVDDNYDDDAETVVIDVVHEGTTVATGTITIADDDDAPVVSVAVDNASVAEAGGTSTVTVSTGSGSTFEDDQTITLTPGGTATVGDDYTIGSTSLTLLAGEDHDASEITTTVTAVQDKIDDDAETIVVNAALGSGLSATAIGSATVTIDDDDDAPVVSVSVNNASVVEAAGTSTVTVSTGSGSTFEDAQTITLTLADTGTATESEDYTIGSKTLTLPAGSGTAASSITTTITSVQDKIDEPDETILIDADRATGVSTSVDVGTRQTVTISDDDAAPVLLFTLSSATVAEAGGTSTVTVSTGTGSTFEDAQTITLTLAGTGTATVDADFTIGSTTLTLPAGVGTAASSITTTIEAVQDKIDDEAETILIDADRATGVLTSVDVGTRQTVTITDDDAAPVLSLNVSSATIAEAGETSTVTVSTDTGSTFASDQTISLALGGTATVIDDYSIGATTLTLPAGVGTAAAEITTTITAVDDDFFEGTTNEQLTVTGSRAGTDFGAARIITITENEMAPKLTLTLADDSISEDGGSTTVTASVAPRTVDAFTVTFSVAPNAPATAADYDLVGTLAFAALSATPTGTVTVTANNNRVDRPDKTVAVTATSSESYFRATDAVTLTFEDEDAAPAPVLEVSVSPIAEDAGASTVTVTTGEGSTFPDAQTVILSLTGSATETADYTIVSKSLTLPAGSGLDVSTVTTTVTGVNDIIDDDAETVLIDAAIGATAVGTQQSITITDDDAAPVPTIGVSPGAIAENGGISTVTVTTGTGSTFAADRTVTLTLTGTAAESADYTITSKSLTLSAGVGLTGSQVTASLTGVNDAIDEADETVLIDAAIGATAVGTQQSVSVEDDDAAPVLEFRVSATQIAENGGVSTVTVTTGTGSTFVEQQTVTLAVAGGGTAIEGSDYRVGSKTLTLPAGAGLAASTVTTTVTGLDDANYEGSTDQTLTLSAAHGNDAVGTPKTIAIDDDEAPSKTVLVLTPSTISEDSGRSMVTATVSPPSEVGFWLKTRIAGPDGRFTWQAFSGDGPFGYIEIEAGETVSVTRTHSVFGVDDEEALGDFNVNMTAEVIGFIPRDFADLPNPLPGIQAPAAVTLTVEDDDTADTTVTLSVDVGEVGEGAGATTVTVTGTLSGDAPAGATAMTLSVDTGAGDTGAVSGTDFTAVEDFQLTIPVGQTSAAATFTLTPIEDSIDEPAETLTLSGAPVDTGVGVAGAVTLDIADNDDAPALVLSVDTAAIAEAGGTATVTVTTGTGSTYAASQTVTLALTGTATGGSDYTIAQTSLVLPAGTGTTASSVNTTITGVDDTAADPGETIIVAGSVDGTAFGEAQTVTITDDEGTSTVTLILTPEAVFEGETSTVTARVSPISPTAFTVTVSAAAESPADADDFTLNGATLSFAANAAQSSGTVTIEAADDNEDTDDKTVTVSGTVSAAGVTAPQDMDLTIRDDEGAVTLALEVGADTIAEAGGTATVTVTTGTGSTFNTAQTIALTLDGTAVRGTDYTIGATTLTLPAGSTSIDTTVTALADDVFEGNETLTVSGLIDGVGFGAGRTITLTDDNPAPTITLVLTPDSISEADGESSVTATLSGPSAIPLEVTVSAEAVAPAVAADFALTGSTLSFAANDTASTGAVTVAASDNPVDAPDKQVRITGSVTDGRFTVPEVVLLTLEDDDEASNSVTITVDPAEAAEEAGPTELTVTATYSAGARQQPSNFTISVLSGGGEDAALSGVDFTAVSDLVLTIPANETAGSVTLTLEPLQDIISEGPEVLSISATSGNPDIGVTETPTVTIADDDAAPSLVLEVSAATMGEGGGTAVVTVSTGDGSTFESDQAIELSLAGSAATGGDYTIGSTSLSLPAGSGETASSITTALSAVDDIVDEPGETIEVSAALGETAIGTETVTITDDDAAPVLVLSVNPETILENGGVSTVTVSTGGGSTFAAAQTVSLRLAGTATEQEDYTLSSGTLTLPAGAGFDDSSVTAEIAAVDDERAEGDETVIVTGTLGGVAFGAAQTLNIADDEGAARVLLLLSTPSVSENGGAATVRAVVSPPVSEAFTVTVSAAAEAPGGPEDFVLAGAAGAQGATLSFAADATESTGEVTITAVDNNRREADKTITVSGAVSLEGVEAPPEVLLTIDEDDAPPAVTLVLTPDSIAEDGGVSRVTATLNTAVAEPFTVTVSAAAVADDFTLGGTTLSFAAEATESTGEVTITAVDNNRREADKTITVSGAVSLEGVEAPPEVLLTIDEDDAPPAVTLVLTPDSIAEDGGVSRVTATLNTAVAEPFTVTVSAAAVAPAVADDFTLGGTTLSFAAEATESTGEVTITAVDNEEDAEDKTVTVSGTVTLEGVAAPAGVTLTISDDDEARPGDAPAVTLVLTPDSIAEDGGVSRVTATLNTAVAEPFTVTVSAAAVAPAVADDFTLGGTTLSFAAEATESTGEVTITAVDNEEDAEDKTVTISGTVTLEGVTAPAGVTLTISDDDEAPPGEMPAVTLVLTPATIAENGGVSRVTATVSPASSQAFTVTVAAAAVEPAVADDFTLSGATLSFAADATESTGEVTITAVDNDEDAPDRTVAVSGTVSLDSVTAPPDAILTITDDDVTEPPGEMPAVTLVLTPATIAENGGVSRVTATVSPASREAFAVTVAAAAVEPAVAGDFTLSGATLSFAADATESTGEVTIAAVDNDEDAPDRTVAVSGTVSLEGVTAPPDAILTITNDDVTEPPGEMPAVTLVLTPATIAENSGVSRVTATVSPASSEAFTVTVAAAAVEPAVAGDFTLSGATLSFAADATESTGEVTITAVDNDEDAPDRTVAVSGTVSLDSVTAPPDAILTITNDDVTEPPGEMPAVTLVLTPATIAENSGVSRVTATVSPASSEAFTVTVAAAAVEPAVAGDFTLSGATLSFAADATESTGEVTITAVDNDEDAPDRTVAVSGTVSLDSVTAPPDAILTITNDDVTEPPGEMPAVTLVLTPATIAENGGVSRVTAIVSPASSEAFTVTVAAAAVDPAVADDFTLSGATLSFVADATESTGEVTIAAVDNDEDAEDKTVTVSGTVTLEGVTAPAGVTLTISDDDEALPAVKRGVDISPTALTIGEGDDTGGSYNVNLIAEPSEDVTVTVSAPAGSGLMVAPAQLTFTSADWQTAQNVAVTAGVDDDADDQTVTLTHAATGAGYESVAIADVKVTVTDRIDPGLPAVSVADARGSEGDGQLVFDVTLSRVADRAVNVAFATGDGTAKAGEDYEARTGTASIAAGGRATQVVVRLRIDLFSEPDETLTLTLSRADGARLGDAQATGVIEDPAEDGAASKLWLARFSRMVGGQVMSNIGERIASDRVGESQLTIAGTRLTGGNGADAFGSGSAGPDRFGQGGFGLTASAGWDGQVQPAERPWSSDGFGATGGRTATGREFLARSAFLLNAGSGGGNGFAVWGRGAYTRFDNLGEGIRTSGDAVTTTLGVDWACARCLLGIALSHTVVDATYGTGGQESGELESTVTGLYPYLGVQISERFSVWGLVGQGEGELTATPAAGQPAQVDLKSRLAGLGARGELIAADNGFSLAVKTDALYSHTSTGRAEGIVDAEGDYWRARLGLEGAWQSRFGDDASLRSSFEVAARHDGGDAETGFGLDVGAGLVWSEPKLGIQAELRGRGLLTHESKGLRERGVSGSFAWEPGQGTGRGPKLTVTQTYGGPASGGADALLGRETVAGPAANDSGDGGELRSRRLELKYGYGFSAFGDGFTSTPGIGMGLSDTGRDYSLGWRLTRVAGDDRSLEFSFEARRRENANDNAGPEHAIGLRLSARF